MNSTLSFFAGVTALSFFCLRVRGRNSTASPSVVGSFLFFVAATATTDLSGNGSSNSTSVSGLEDGIASAAGSTDCCCGSGECFASAGGGTATTGSGEGTSKASGSGEDFALPDGGADADDSLAGTDFATFAAKVDCDCALRATFTFGAGLRAVFTFAAGFASSTNRDTVIKQVGLKW